MSRLRTRGGPSGSTHHAGVMGIERNSVNLGNNRKRRQGARAGNEIGCTLVLARSVVAAQVADLI